MVWRARLELARRPRLQCAVPCPGIGETFGIVARGPQAAVIVGIAAGVAVFYSLGRIALAVLFITRLRYSTMPVDAVVTLILPATGALPGLEDLLAALAAQSLRPSRLIVDVESAATTRLMPASLPLARALSELEHRARRRRPVAAAQPKMHQLLAALGASRSTTTAHSSCSTPISGRSPGGSRRWSRRWPPGAPISSMATAGRCRRPSHSPPRSPPESIVPSRYCRA